MTDQKLTTISHRDGDATIHGSEGKAFMLWLYASAALKGDACQMKKKLT